MESETGDTFEITAVRHALSEARFARYLAAVDGDEQVALELYEWNLKAAGVAFANASHFEVVLRNRLISALRQAHADAGGDGRWFCPESDPVVRKARYGRLRLTRHHHGALEQAYRTVSRLPTASSEGSELWEGRVAAELSLGFWAALFSRAQQTLWNTHLNSQFSGYVPVVGVRPRASRSGRMRPPTAREALQADLNVIKVVRNRIAHHEAIFASDLDAWWTILTRVLAVICADTATWVSGHSRMPHILSEHRGWQDRGVSTGR